MILTVLRAISTSFVVLLVFISIFLFVKVNDEQGIINHQFCDYFYREATSPVTLNKTSAFGVTDIVNARYTVVRLGCVSSLPPPSHDLLLLEHEFHVLPAPTH
jgi:hypothetical protein